MPYTIELDTDPFLRLWKSTGPSEANTRPVFWDVIGEEVVLVLAHDTPLVYVHRKPLSFFQAPAPEPETEGIIPMVPEDELEEVEPVESAMPPLEAADLAERWMASTFGPQATRATIRFPSSTGPSVGTIQGTITLGGE